jgi:ribosomal protein L21E
MGEGIPEGTAVLIHGLTKSTQHNGSVGTVVAHDEAESGRVVVRLNGSADVLALQPHNLQLLLPCTLSGLTSAARLNGTRAFIRGEAGNGRYLVTVPEEGVDQIAVKLRNIVLGNDTPIAIEGLQPSSRHNGRTGVVVDAVPDGSRYTIQTGDGLMLKVKPEHLRVRLSSL